MKTFFTKYKILIAIVVVLLVLNLSVLATIFFHNYRYRHVTSRPGLTQPLMPFREGMFLRDELRLNEHQFTQFRSDRDAYQKHVANLEGNIQKKKMQLLAELIKTSPDTDKIKSISDEIGQLQTKLLVETSDYYFDIRKLCNDEQKILLDRFFTRVINGEEYMPDRFLRRGSRRIINNNRSNIRNDD